MPTPTIVTVNNPAVHTPSEEYTQYIETNYIVPGKLVIEHSADTATGYVTKKLKFASTEAYAEFSADSVVLAEREAGSASVVGRNIYQVYQQPI
jgi:hypothetical protein